MHVQVITSSDFAEGLKLITSVVFLFQEMENQKWSPSKKKGQLRPIHLICHPQTSTSCLRSKGAQHFDCDDVAITAVNHFLEVKDTDFYKE